ncbi:MAG: nitronate monooxygenase [Mucinivorans sp.]
MKNCICHLFGIQHPIISGGMVWCSGHRLASSVSLAGGLGLIGAGSMHPDVLRYHIQQCRIAVQGRPFGVNLPLFYPELEQVIAIVIEEKVPIVFTSGGNPALYTSRLKSAGITVVHVVASAKFAIKAQKAGVDAVVAEGFEAGGHNGRDELTTMVLIPQVVSAVDIPVIAAGGIANGAQWAASIALGASAVQIGSLFALSQESSAHQNFKELCLGLGESDTMLSLKKLSPVRLIKNAFYQTIDAAEARGATAQELAELLGRGRAKLGMFEGELNEGELEIGQVVASIDKIESVTEIFERLIKEYQCAILNFH